MFMNQTYKLAQITTSFEIPNTGKNSNAANSLIPRSLRTWKLGIIDLAINTSDNPEASWIMPSSHPKNRSIRMYWKVNIM